MSKGHRLRALVNERLSAAAEEIFALFERTIAEYEEELCRSKEETQSKQELLHSVLRQRAVLPRAGVQVPSTSPDPGLDQGLNQSLGQDLGQDLKQEPPQIQIKEEPEEHSIKQEQVSFYTDEASDMKDYEPKECNGVFSDGSSCCEDLDLPDDLGVSENLGVFEDPWPNSQDIAVSHVISLCDSEFVSIKSECEDTVLSSPDDSTQKSLTQTSVSPITFSPNRSKYNKRQYCLFCQKPIYKLARHLASVHRNEQEVVLAFSFKKGSKKRVEMLRSLKKRGNFFHNATVETRGAGELVACRRPAASQPPSAFVHCPLCHGLYLKKYLWKHMKINHGRSDHMKMNHGRSDHMKINHGGPHQDSTSLFALPKFDPQGAVDVCGFNEDGGRPQTRGGAKKRKRFWTEEERGAVERHMMEFITGRRVPGKKNCSTCLQREASALKDRDWTDVKNYVHNRINALKRLNQDRTGPGPDQDQTRTDPGPDQDWTRTGPGPDQD